MKIIRSFNYPVNAVSITTIKAARPKKKKYTLSVMIHIKQQIASDAIAIIHLFQVSFFI